ncbi:hypothetical protein H6Y62_06055 [Staphylococcus lugdunensis]|jgi:hypothetical protein|uniref:Uncharacterized protein n=2 Tax=Staphylococcus lugdunensis TaxID=28035 RepID=A0A133Q2G9_STALU|nr:MULTISPECIES: hypothetical protein [Staphylococcus]AMG60487.1 hypothetical protein AL499_00640 [Staphylococcus lugdunensis]ARJ11300.1 hypothetical protein B7466_05830 [Staphylococcus lugdunensis]AST60246.1 hypothetical protein BFP67_05300 [Staphylococcus lugdunensis]ATG68723.1 hypothetical protein CPG32_03635 [Staphylococcus lugdunensis]ATN13976.1 hypothetical protein CRN64_00680 [Staphylococcus lugdunensis]
MSDVIPFPRSQLKLTNEIIDAHKNKNHTLVYDLFETYEAHFELDETLSLIKCETLLQLNAFLELREETIILLKKGLQKYDELMIYYIQSLNGLGQYFEAVEVIDQIIDEVKLHETRMALHPMREFAKAQLLEDKQRVTDMLGRFESLSRREQSQLILQLIDNGHYEFKDSIANIIHYYQIPPHVLSVMIEYLRFAQYSKEISIRKYSQTFTVQPNLLLGFEHTSMKTQVIPEVMKKLEDNEFNLLNEARHIMNNHTILLYPLDIYDLYNKQQWIDGYVTYFKSMFDLSNNEDNMSILCFIQQLDKDV